MLRCTKVHFSIGFEMGILEKSTPSRSALTSSRDVGAINPRLAEVLGVRVDDVSVIGLLDQIEDAVVQHRRLLVVNANAHLVSLARTRPWLRTLFERADIAFCDGAGVQFAVKLLTGQLPHRHTPPQWIDSMAARLQPHGASIYWLGGQPDVVARAATIFRERTGTILAGYHHGFFDHHADSADNRRIIDDINRARPDVLLLNLGMPRQEAWLADNWDKLDVSVAITAGALVDHVAGRVKRPPGWVASFGLEWLVRLAVEPRRLWRRYLLGLPPFAARVFLQKGRSMLRA